MIEENTLNIFTDGSSKSNPRRGGVGYIFVIYDNEGNEIIEEFSPTGFLGTTNNQMEILAPTMSLEEATSSLHLENHKRIILKSDSSYFVNNYQNAIFNWPKSGWRNKDTNKPYENYDYWKRFLKIYTKIRNDKNFIDIKWVRGKSDKYTKLVDKLAKKSADLAFNDPLHKESVRRKLVKGETEPGKVKMQGRIMKVYIVSMENLKLKRGYLHRYQVISKKSKFHDVTDFIYTDSLLVRDGHAYLVRVNKETSYPKILKVYCEIDKKTGEPIREPTDKS